MINILFAEDNAIVRRGIIGLLQKQPDLKVVGEAENGLIALQLLKNGLQPDILLADLNMPEMDGLQLVQHISDLGLDLPAIILTMHGNAAFIKKAVGMGVRGYLIKSGNTDEIVACIRDVDKGLMVIGKELEY